MGNAERLNPHARKTEVTLPVVALDRLGRPLGAGDLVTTNVASDLLWEVAQVTPVLDPTAPPNLVTVEMRTKFAVRVPAKRPVPELLQVRPAPQAAQSGPRAMVEVTPAPVAWWRRLLPRRWRRG
jgi:hypothetical protein